MYTGKDLLLDLYSIEKSLRGNTPVIVPNPKDYNKNNLMGKMQAKVLATDLCIGLNFIHVTALNSLYYYLGDTVEHDNLKMSCKRLIELLEQESEDVLQRPVMITDENGKIDTNKRKHMTEMTNLGIGVNHVELLTICNNKEITC